jgi:hypothetical protein
MRLARKVLPTIRAEVLNTVSIKHSSIKKRKRGRVK